MEISNNKILVGVISDNSSVLNRGVDGAPFDVTILDGNPKFKVKTLNGSSDLLPVIMAMPHWYTRKAIYPVNIAEISVAIEVSEQMWQNDRSFVVHAGSNKYSSGRQLGFDFIALDPNIDDKNLVYGYVGLSGQMAGKNWSSTEEVFKKEISVINQNELCKEFGESASCDPALIEGGDVGGVRIKFQTSFTDIPTIIITPVLSSADECYPSNDSNGYMWTNTKISIPHCVVESVSATETYVKCGCFTVTNPNSSSQTKIKFTNTPFSFLAMGPTKDSEYSMFNKDSAKFDKYY